MGTIHQIVVFFFVFLLISCKSATNKEVSGETPKAFTCKPYFEFDQLEHYYSPVSDFDTSIWKLIEKETLSAKEKRLMELLTQQKPASFSDTSMLKGIEDLGFQKRILPSKQFQAINEVFCERKHENNNALTAIGMYKDILVFKRQNQIIGFAKVSFEKMYSIIAGTDKNTDECGQSGDYQKLYRLLHP